MNNEITVEELAKAIGGRVAGDANKLIKRVANLDDATEEALAFINDDRMPERGEKSRAGCLIVAHGKAIKGVTCIETANPKLGFARAARLLMSDESLFAGVHETACVALEAKLGESVLVAAHASVGAGSKIGARTKVCAGARIGERVEIGEDSIVGANVVIYDCMKIGSRTVLHAGVVIGADGFGFVRDANEYIKFPQIGVVVIEDDVEIGANSCVDRGSLGETRIGQGTKIDNLVQVGHNVQIGKRVVIAAQTGISGSCVIEDDTVIGGQVGIGDHAHIQSGAIIGSQAGVLPGKRVRGGGKTYWGTPIRALDEYKIINAAFGRLPQMRDELERLRKAVAEINEAKEK